MNARLRSLDAQVLAASLVALVVLGPLRSILDDLPTIIPFASAMVLFTAPGMLLAHWSAREHLRGTALIPVSFAFSAGLFGLLGVPVLVLHTSLDFYLAACGAVLAAFLAVATVRVFRQRPETGKDSSAPSGFGERWMWLPFLSLGGVLIYLAALEVPLVDGDTWNYLAWSREYLHTDRLAYNNPYFGGRTPELSRVKVNGWILEQAALSRLSGIELTVLVFHYLSPALVAVSLLAFHALARSLFKSDGAALLTGCLYILFLLFHLDATSLSFGGEFLARILQDKGFARFVYLPVALIFALAFLEDRKLRHLFLFGFLCWAVVTVHPAGLAIIGLSVAGLGLLYVISAWRRRTTWIGASALGLALLSILLVPAGYVLATGEPLSAALYSADIGNTDPAVLDNQVFVRDEWKKIFVLESGSYIMHPSLVFNPVITTGYVLGVPFLIWRARRSLAAQLLLGMLLVSTAVSYVPPLATFLGDQIVAPGQLHRLAWPIPLAALLTLGWVLWEMVGYASKRLSLARYVYILPTALVLALAVAGAPSALDGIRAVHGREIAGSSFDPIFRWMQRNIDEPSVVLAPDGENVAIPAYSANANVVSFRGRPVLDHLRELERVSGEEIEVPQGALDVRRFYSARATPAEMRRILVRHEVDYVLVPAGSIVDERLKRLPVLDPLKTPSERYTLYAVDPGGRHT